MVPQYKLLLQRETIPHPHFYPQNQKLSGSPRDKTQQNWKKGMKHERKILIWIIIDKKSGNNLWEYFHMREILLGSLTKERLRRAHFHLSIFQCLFPFFFQFETARSSSLGKWSYQKGYILRGKVKHAPSWHNKNIIRYNMSPLILTLPRIHSAPFGILANTKW